MTDTREDRTVGDALRFAHDHLPESPARASESERIVSAVLASERMIEVPEPSRIKLELYSRMKDPISSRCFSRVVDLVNKRATGQPLQYLLGGQYFLEHHYQVGPGVLVPRPETEVLVHTAFEHLESRGAQPMLGLELGIGSGIISIELLKQFTGLRMLASEASPAARGWAEKNAKNLLGPDTNRLTLLGVEDPTDLWTVFESALMGARADFFISNPPYLSRDGSEVDSSVTDHEPETALFPPGPDLLHYYRGAAERLPEFLKPGGLVFMEISHHRARETVELFRLNFHGVEVLLDLTGRPRVLIAKVR